jgi:sigma-B regulation protein RsbU (phosphoserine phosphatase)
MEPESSFDVVLSMNVLVADDDQTSRQVLNAILTGEHYSVTEVDNGLTALETLQSATEAFVALIDWEMPGMEGTEVCRRVRELSNSQPIHLILLTARDSKSDVVQGLRTGANDYIVKPFNRTELLARVSIGAQMVGLQRSLTRHIAELESALKRVKQLGGLLPICSYCKKIRDDSNYWQQVESYVMHHSDAQFSHSICPSCYESIVKPEMARLGVDVNAPVAG